MAYYFYFTLNLLPLIVFFSHETFQSLLPGLCEGQDQPLLLIPFLKLITDLREQF